MNTNFKFKKKKVEMTKEMSDRIIYEEAKKKLELEDERLLHVLQETKEDKINNMSELVNNYHYAIDRVENALSNGLSGYDQKKGCENLRHMIEDLIKQIENEERKGE